MSVVTLKKLRDALAYAFSYTLSEAYKKANIILDLFGFDDYIIDNILTPEERKLILSLQAKGMISLLREDTTINNGIPWRIYYWHLDTKAIMKYAKNKKNNNCKNIDTPDQEYINIYETITDTQWNHRG
ncbi:MAG: DUF6015 family protein [Candidatus Thermoplasmatota archaeon]